LNPEDIPTKSAFCQARNKIKNAFYFDFFEKSHTLFYENTKGLNFKNYRLWACDTTVQKLPDNAETRKLGTHTNQAQTVASIKILTYFDVLNQLIVRADTDSKNTSDLRCAQKHIANIPNDVIAIYDRGFAGHLLPFLHGHYGSKYVLRLSTTFSNTVVDFMKSDDVDITVNEPLTQKCCKELANMGIRKSKQDTISFRLVKIKLQTGETEVLMTNLDNSFTIEDLNYIYQNRWKIETSYNYLKNTFMLGTFSGYSQKAVIQDIYCVLIIYNLQTIIQFGCNEQLEEVNTNREEKYKINRNISAGTVRNYLKKLFLSALEAWELFLQKAQETILNSVEKIKPNDKERERKMLRCNDRHQTELNYKRGF
jgi:hypothetical protein